MELFILINSLKLLRNKQIKKIPKKTLFDLFNILKYEKIIKFINNKDDGVVEYAREGI